MNTNSQKRRIRVLAIDDEPGHREMLVFGLSERGYDVTTATNGEEAILIAAKGAFDMAICDMKMPGMSGMEVVKALQRLQPTLAITIVTGYANLENAVESYEQGSYGYIAKPYGLDELCAILEQAWERRQRLWMRAA